MPTKLDLKRARLLRTAQACRIAQAATGIVILAWALDADRIARSTALGSLNIEIFTTRLDRKSIDLGIDPLLVREAKMHILVVRFQLISCQWAQVARSIQAFFPARANSSRFQSTIPRLFRTARLAGRVEAQRCNVIGILRWVKIILRRYDNRTVRKVGCSRLK